MSNCANCGQFACWDGRLEKIPDHCPMQDHQEFYEETLREYEKEEIKNISYNSALVESEGYGIWTRLEEIIEFSWRAGFKELGLAFCVGLRKEARQVSIILQNAGFKVTSVVCKTGAQDKEKLGLNDSQKVRPGQFEAMCNPIAQAGLLKEAGTQLNILLGLCVGHDTLFIRYSSAPITVLAVKDRVLAHNPLGAIYAEHYFKAKLASHQKQTDVETGDEISQQLLEAVKKAAVDGKLTCSGARQLAAKLKVRPRTVGNACNSLKIKLKSCELGCF
ncbi:MAG TPA: metal-binding protein [Desulfotomaculum sp.]|nr:MAG: hypothetical protein XD84_0715 [Desulfotomaculum sp. 46_80]HAG10525.1 metal-binding protein [Desulfotomaculum sp.]HBY04052.1 metal-binding protein [Desulfotomaculum sp.]